MRIRYATGTSRGKIREQNEDSFTVIDCREKDFMVFVVADGMGGMDYGDIASRMAVEFVEKAYSGCRNLGDTITDVRTAIENLFSKINIEIINASNEKESIAGMGTTLSMCFIDREWVNVGHIGDSRIYLFRGSEYLQLTKDHSYVENLVDTGRITREQARNHPNKNIITRALGIDMEAKADYSREKIETGDRILLCSDGLTNELDDNEISIIISGQDTPEAAVEKLLEKANELGGRDNVTVLLAYID